MYLHILFYLIFLIVVSIMLTIQKQIILFINDFLTHPNLHIKLITMVFKFHTINWYL